MKKVTYLFVLMFSLVFMSTSCEKDPVTPDDPSTALITLAELNGTWDFQKYSNTGIADITPATTCEQIANPVTSPVTAGKRWIKLGLNIETQYNLTTCDLIDACDATTPDNFLELDGVNNKITLDNGIVWKILSYDKTSKVLVLKLLEPVNSTDYILDGGTYTLKKQ